MTEWLVPFLPAGALVVIELILLATALIVVPPNRRPSSALAWIILIVVIPVVGLLLFSVIGSPKLPKARRDVQRSINDRIHELAANTPEPAPARHIPDWVGPIATLNRNVGALPLVDGNHSHLITEFDDQIAAMVAAIDRAESYVFVEFYIVGLDEGTRPFFDAMRRAVERGVEIHMLLDHIGSLGYPGYKPATRELDDMGVVWALMLPVLPLQGKYQRPDLRNHRKLVVVDGEIGFVGSLNLIHPSYEKRKNRKKGLHWRDVLAEVRGPVVQEIEAVFASDWFSETGDLPRTVDLDESLVPEEGDTETLLAQIAPSGPAFETENNLALFNSLLYAAERRVSITSPYFVPDESLLAAIVTAARRGVAVELFVGGIGDKFFTFHAQHSYYDDLLHAGVRIYEYPGPTILHSKHVSIDDAVSVVGSSNMDIRSFQLDLELMMFVAGESFTDDMKRVEDGYRAVSTELTLDAWNRRGRLHAIADNFTRLTSAVQ